MPRGVWNDRSPGKRSAAARKGAASRNRRAERRRLRDFLDGKGPPLDCPEGGTATDRVLTGPQISALIGRIKGRQEPEAEAAE